MLRLPCGKEQRSSCALATAGWRVCQLRLLKRCGICPRSLFEQLAVELYFKNQTGAAFTSYWLGLRQRGLGSAAW